MAYQESVNFRVKRHIIFLFLYEIIKESSRGCAFMYCPSIIPWTYASPTNSKFRDGTGRRMIGTLVPKIMATMSPDFICLGPSPSLEFSVLNIVLPYQICSAHSTSARENCTTVASAELIWFMGSSGRIASKALSRGHSLLAFDSFFCIAVCLPPTSATDLPEGILFGQTREQPPAIDVLT